METNSAGQVVLYPMPGYDAEKAGVQNFDILLDINGQPINQTTDINKQLNGRVGEPLTITVRKSDGSEKTYKLVRSSVPKPYLTRQGFPFGFLTGYCPACPCWLGWDSPPWELFCCCAGLPMKCSFLTAGVLCLSCLQPEQFKR